MLKRTVAIVSTALACLASPMQAEDCHILQRIDVVIEGSGNRCIDDVEAVCARLKTRINTPFCQEDFDEDLKSLSRDYDRVEPEITYDDGCVDLKLHLWPKPSIRCVSFEGNECIRTSTLESELGVHCTDTFDRACFNQAFHQLKAYYVGKGYFEAELNYKTSLDELTNEVDVCITIDEGRCGLINKVVFCGFTREEQCELSEMILTKPYSFLKTWMTGQGTFRKEMVQQDEYVILNYIQNKGYADARVDIEVLDSPSKNRINVVINLERGDLYEFGPVTFSGNTLFSDEEILRQLCIREGDYFSPDKVRESSKAISDYYGKQGYIDAYASFTPTLDQVDPTYSVHFDIHEGEQYRVGLIKVFGNCTTHTEVILHETLLVPGEVFNICKLQSTEQRLRNIGYFESVNVYAVRSDADSDAGPSFRDLHIEVEEKSTGDFGFSFGMSTSENAYLGLTLTERNFDHCGIPCIFQDGYYALRGGGEYLHITANIGQRTSSYNLSWTQPYFRDTPWSVGIDLDKTSNKTKSRDYDIDAYGVSLHATRPINQFLKLAWHYRLRHSDVSVPADASSKLIQEAQNSGLISATGLALIYDSTNHPMLPTKGFRSRLSGEVAGLGGRHEFFNLSYINALYYSPINCGILKLRADLRFIHPFGDTDLGTLPLDERLFLGGENSVRGYRAYAIGPKYPLSDDPRGGLSHVLTSAEFVYKAFSMADLFVFADAGSLRAAQWSIGTMRASAGYGARLYVMPGGPPLVIGMGYPINPNSKSDVKRFFLTLGGRF